MPIKAKDEKQKKGLLAAIWESMTKTGGCCDSGGNCCSPSDPNSGDKKDKKKKGNRVAGEPNES